MQQTHIMRARVNTVGALQWMMLSKCVEGGLRISYYK